MIRFVARTRTYPPCWVLKARIQKHRCKPLLFHDKCHGFFYVHYEGRRTKQLWLSVLLKDTSAATGQAGIRTHILATPELESNALDRSATTYFKIKFNVFNVMFCYYYYYYYYFIFLHNNSKSTQKKNASKTKNH